MSPPAAQRLPSAQAAPGLVGRKDEKWLVIPDPQPRSRAVCASTSSAKTRRLSVVLTRPGQQWRARIKETEYLLQLQEKQKARFTYGVMEKQFRRYYEEANRRTRQDRRRPAEDPGDPSTTSVPRRTGQYPSPGPSAGQPRPLHRPVEGRRPQRPSRPVRHHRCPAEVAGDRAVPDRQGDPGPICRACVAAKVVPVDAASSCATAVRACPDRPCR